MWRWSLIPIVLAWLWVNSEPVQALDSPQAYRLLLVLLGISTLAMLRVANAAESELRSPRRAVPVQTAIGVGLALVMWIGIGIGASMVRDAGATAAEYGACLVGGRTLAFIGPAAWAILGRRWAEAALAALTAQVVLYAWSYLAVAMQAAWMAGEGAIFAAMGAAWGGAFLLLRITQWYRTAYALEEPAAE